MANGTRVATGESGETAPSPVGLRSDRKIPSAGSSFPSSRIPYSRSAACETSLQAATLEKRPAALGSGSFSCFIHHKITQRAGVARRRVRAAVPSEGTGRGGWFSRQEGWKRALEAPESPGHRVRDRGATLPEPPARFTGAPSPSARVK